MSTDISFPKVSLSSPTSLKNLFLCNRDVIDNLFYNATIKIHQSEKNKGCETLNEAPSEFKIKKGCETLLSPGNALIMTSDSQHTLKPYSEITHRKKDKGYYT